ncbi:unnamed protein product, partial [Iphiclides podalirius]
MRYAYSHAFIMADAPWRRADTLSRTYRLVCRAAFAQNPVAGRLFVFHPDDGRRQNGDVTASLETQR